MDATTNATVTNRGYRPEWWPTDAATGGPLGILWMAEQLHGIYTGGVEEGPMLSVHLVQCLKHADENWTVMTGDIRAFDNAVRQVIRAAIAEWECRHC